MVEAEVAAEAEAEVAALGKEGEGFGEKEEKEGVLGFLINGVETTLLSMTNEGGATTGDWAESTVEFVKGMPSRSVIGRPARLVIGRPVL